jgi:hypothetical protein
MPGPPSVADVKQEAQRLVEKRAEELEKQGGIPLSKASQVEAAAMVPGFSRGTQALDDETGEPIISDPSGRIPLPDAAEAGGATDALAAAKAEISGEAEPPAAEVKQRDKKSGRFVAEETQGAPIAQAVAPDAAAPPPVAAAPDVSTPEARAEAAADAVADSIPDPWADYEELEYEDPTLDKKFTVRAPKEIAQQVKSGYMRRADYTRKSMFLGKAREALEPLVADGTLQNLLPLITMGVRDPEFAQFVAEAAQRRAQGQPLIPQQAAPQQQPTQNGAPQPPPIPVLSAEEDPYMAQVYNPLAQRIEEVTNLVQGLAQTENQREAQRAGAEREMQRRTNIMMSAHQELARRFPDEFTGDITRDNERFQHAANLARDYGYASIYPDNPLTLAMAWGDYRREREEASASPAVAAVAQAAAVERQVITQNAAAVPAGTHSAPAQPAPKKPVPPPTRVNGAPVPPKVYAQQVAQYQRQLAAYNARQ